MCNKNGEKIYYGFTEETREKRRRDDDVDALAFYVNA